MYKIDYILFVKYRKCYRRKNASIGIESSVEEIRGEPSELLISQKTQLIFDWFSILMNRLGIWDLNLFFLRGFAYELILSIEWNSWTTSNKSQSFEIVESICAADITSSRCFAAISIRSRV